MQTRRMILSSSLPHFGHIVSAKWAPGEPQVLFGENKQRPLMVVLQETGISSWQECDFPYFISCLPTAVARFGGLLESLHKLKDLRQEASINLRPETSLLVSCDVCRKIHDCHHMSLFLIVDITIFWNLYIIAEVMYLFRAPGCVVGPRPAGGALISTDNYKTRWSSREHGGSKTWSSFSSKKYIDFHLWDD